MHFIRTLRIIAFVAFACAVTVMMGCGPAKTDVSGTIKISGKAPNIKGLEIVLLGSDGSIVAAPINPDGTYAATGVTAGEVKVIFAYIPNKAAEVSGKRNLNKPTDRVNTKDVPPNPIPESLRDGSTTKVTFTAASSGKNVFNFDIR